MMLKTLTYEDFQLTGHESQLEEMMSEIRQRNAQKNGPQKITKEEFEVEDAEASELSCDVNGIPRFDLLQDGIHHFLLDARVSAPFSGSFWQNQILVFRVSVSREHGLLVIDDTLVEDLLDEFATGKLAKHIRFLKRMGEKLDCESLCENLKANGFIGKIYGWMHCTDAYKEINEDRWYELSKHSSGFDGNEPWPIPFMWKCAECEELKDDMVFDYLGSCGDGGVGVIHSDPICSECEHLDQEHSEDDEDDE